jgi:hypothetical protein
MARFVLFDSQVVEHQVFCIRDALRVPGVGNVVVAGPAQS